MPVTFSQLKCTPKYSDAGWFDADDLWFFPIALALTYATSP